MIKDIGNEQSTLLLNLWLVVYEIIFNNKLWFLTPLQSTYMFGFCIGGLILIRGRGCQKETRDTSFSCNLFSGLGRIPSLVTSFAHTLVAMQSLVRDLLCLLLNQVSFKVIQYNIKLQPYSFVSQSKRQQLLNQVIVNGLQLFLASKRPSVQV